MTDEKRKEMADEMGLPIDDITLDGKVYINYECKDCDADICVPCSFYHKRLNQIERE